jgi:hypothetical protein
MYGILGTLPEHGSARERLGVPADTFLYLCLADQHTERELLHLIAAFVEVNRVLEEREGIYFVPPQLLIAGRPRSQRIVHRLVHRAAFTPGLHLCIGERMDDLAWYVGATDALVQPYCGGQNVGVLDLAVLFYSYERVVIAPDTPRLQGMLPAPACLLYDPASMEALVSALLNAPGSTHRLKEKETAALNVMQGWGQYAKRLLELYKPLLER